MMAVLGMNAPRKLIGPDSVRVGGDTSTISLAASLHSSAEDHCLCSMLNRSAPENTPC